MAKHRHTGILGENLAVEYFFNMGYKILYRNWRHGHWEVDIIAEKEPVLHFIEVKTRRTKRFGLPEDNVDKKKIQNLVSAAEAFLYLFPHWKRIQFDILSITMLMNEPVEYFLIEDVYL